MSNIPRLSRIPVRSSATNVQRPEQLTGDQPMSGTSEVDSIKVSRSRPRTDGSNPNGRPALETNGFAKPPANHTSARKQAPISSVSIIEEMPTDHAEQPSEQPMNGEPARTKVRKPRPSLSDRAIETLSQIPPSPSPRRRQSGFFPTDSPAVRPPSSLGRSRPGTSTGFYPPLPTSRPTSPLKKPGTTRSREMNACTPSKHTVGAGTVGRTTRPPFKPLRDTQNPRSTVKESKAVNSGPKGSPRMNIRAEAPLEKGSQITGSASSTASPKPSSKSSAALRETIANAKAARRAAPKYEADEIIKPVNPNPQAASLGGDDGIHVNILRKRINSARSDGKLNISAMGLKEFPKEVLNMYESNTMTNGPTWYESVDLIRLDASNNQLEDLGWDYLDERAEDRPQGNIFNGLQSLDLHGNLLRSLPSSLHSLEHLTILNLSRNRLGQISGVVYTVSKIASIRELYLAENDFSGPFPPLIWGENLEILDLHANAFSSLPEELSKCRSIRRLDISANKITQLPRLELPNLMILNVSVNQIAVQSLMTNLTAPKLTDLDISMCRINNLPALKSRYPNLTSVIAYDNRIPEIEVESVRGLEVLDLRRNDIRSLPPELGLLGLKKFLVSGNPMRVPR
ncbi:MAG: hypothetical protein Q9225_007464 [Loekoesia sp. 1 TL-2023]